ncbi:hypothetical protein EDB84DRAFT_1492728 [Lactarius hengduanensis]|nr:hypothetical protein EDB84DRAFT_1492728 [Lactarius hengduanensis]
MPIHCEFDITQRSLNFPRPFVDSPRLAHGLRVLDIGNNANIRVSSILQHITKSSADCNIITWANTTLYHAVANVFALAPCDLDFLTGEHTRSFWKNPNDPASVRIDFERPFVTPPKVVVFFNCIELSKYQDWRLKTTATDIDVGGFTLNIDTIFYTVAARVGWIAYPEDRGHIFSTDVSTLDVRPVEQRQHLHNKEISFNSVEFIKKPSVFIALNSLDVSPDANLRVSAYVDGISTTRLVWHIDSWADTVLFSAGATIIAFNNN